MGMVGAAAPDLHGPVGGPVVGLHPLRRAGRVRGLGLAAALAVPSAVAAPASADVVLTHVRTIGGPLHAQMYPSGMDTGADGTVVIADTGNNEVAKYASDGRLLWRTARRATGSADLDNPRDVGVDAAGNVFVADTRNSRLVKLGPDGAYLGETRGPTGDPMSFPFGVSVAGGRVYVADTGWNKVRVFDTALTQRRTIVGTSACSLVALRDADADAAGNVYVAGYKTNEVLVFSPTGTCLRKWGNTGTAAGQFRTPYGVDVATDPVTSRELVYVAEGLNNRVQAFDTSGGLIGALGSFGEPEVVGTFTTMRRVAAARDGTGDVWAADLWGNRVERWRRSATGWTYAETIGAVMPRPTSAAVFHEPRGLAWSADGTLRVADTVHHSVASFSATDELIGTCGKRAAEGSLPGQFNWPRGVAVDHATGNLWIADTNQSKIQVLSASCTNVAQIGTGAASTALTGFHWPYSIAIRQSDRIAFVADSQNHRVMSYDVATRRPIAAYGVKGGGTGRFRSPSGVAVDPATGHVLVADAGNNRVVELSDTAGSGMTQVRVLNAGLTLSGPEGVAVDGSGQVAVADSSNNRVVVLDAGGAVVATQGGLDHPASVAFGPDGLLYVSNTYADTVEVYSLGSTPADTMPPDGWVTVPSAGQSLPVGPVRFAGTATDNRAVSAAKVAVRDLVSGRWQRPDGSWGAFAWLDATLASPGAASSPWSYSWTAPTAGSYSVMLRVDDAAGNTDPTRPVVRFTVVG
jgi:DNA-binding beta-propeller fold protein YncE